MPGAFAGVGAQQRLVAVPAGLAGGEQAGVGEPFQDAFGAGRGFAEQAGGGAQADGVGRGEGQQVEGAGGRRVEALAARREGRADVQAAEAEFVQGTALVDDPLHQVPDRPGGPGGEPGTADPQGQRQPAAGGGELAERPGFGVRPGRADQPGEELPGLVGGQRPEVQGVAAAEVGQPGTGGDQGGVAGPGGHQRPDVGAVAGVVQDDQCPSA
ncbi:hypothetical protein ACFQ1I_33735 [Kitasatospora arboriphila]